MRVFTVLCIGHNIVNPQVVVSNYTDKNKAINKYNSYLEEDKEIYAVTNERVDDFEALNRVLEHFSAFVGETNEPVEEVFLIETEDIYNV